MITGTQSHSSRSALFMCPLMRLACLLTLSPLSVAISRKPARKLPDQFTGRTIFFGHANKNKCPGGSFIITDKTACKHAASSLGVKWGSAGDFGSSSPAWCFQNKKEGKIYFSMDGKGSEDKTTWKDATYRYVCQEATRETKAQKKRSYPLEQDEDLVCEDDDQQCNTKRWKAKSCSQEEFEHLKFYKNSLHGQPPGDAHGYTPARRSRWSRTLKWLGSKFHQAKVSACDKSFDPKRRTLLMPFVPPYSGSTALSSIFMSSANVTTICSAGTWQCEGTTIMTDEGYCKYSYAWDYDRMLHLFSKHWNLQLPVLLEKNPANIRYVKEDREKLIAAKIPLSMQKLGVVKLDLVYVIMWRPRCLSTLSHNYRKAYLLDSVRSLNADINRLQELVDAHRYLMDMGEPVLVINMGDLIWRPHETKSRIERFMPCLGDLNLDFIPEEGSDIFKGNHWKVQGSVESYGEKKDPKKFGYNVDERTCFKEIDQWPFWDKNAEGKHPSPERLSELVAHFEERESYLRRFS